MPDAHPRWRLLGPDNEALQEFLPRDAGLRALGLAGIPPTYRGLGLAVSDTTITTNIVTIIATTDVLTRFFVFSYFLLLFCLYPISMFIAFYYVYPSTAPRSTLRVWAAVAG